MTQVKSGSIIAAGAVVEKGTTVPSGEVWAGARQHPCAPPAALADAVRNRLQHLRSARFPLPVSPACDCVAWSITDAVESLLTRLPCARRQPRQEAARRQARGGDVPEGAADHLRPAGGAARQGRQPAVRDPGRRGGWQAAAARVAVKPRAGAGTARAARAMIFSAPVSPVEHRRVEFSRRQALHVAWLCVSAGEPTRASSRR